MDNFKPQSKVSMNAGTIPSIAGTSFTVSSAILNGLPQEDPPTFSRKRCRTDDESLSADDFSANSKNKRIKKRSEDVGIMPDVVCNNILQVLNNNCLIEIISQTCIDIGDLVNVASTSTHFQAIARRVFVSKFFRMTHMKEMREWPLNKIEKYFQHFGEYIQHFCLRKHKYNQNDVLRLIVTHCPNLTSFRCHAWKHIDIELLNKICSKLTYFDWQGRLDGLRIFDTSSSIQHFRFYSSQFELPQMNLPHLLKLQLLFVSIPPDNLIGFLKLNPQLKSLELKNSPLIWRESRNLDEGILPLKNLEEFSFRHFQEPFNSYECFESLTKLKKLKISVPYVSDAINNIGRSVQRANAPLEAVWLESRCNDLNTFNFNLNIDTICQFKSVQKMILNRSIKSSQLPRIIASLPQLKNIDCEIEKLHFDAAHIHKALKIANGLHSLVLGTDARHDECSSISGISTEAKNRNIDVELDFLKNSTNEKEVGDKLCHKRFTVNVSKKKSFHSR